MKYVVEDDSGKKMIMDVATSIPSLPEGWSVLGLVSDLPEIVSGMDLQRNKDELIQIAYDSMNKDVYEQMASVFGTTNPDSASANEKTWSLMQSNPSLFANQGLKDDNGVVMSTEQQVLDYASAKMTAVLNYGIWRLQRIQQFRDARDAIINGN